MKIRYALLLALLTLPTATHAQQTQKPLQIIVPFAPGGSADGIARILALELAAKLNRQAYVENKAGAGGTLGLVALSKSPPDGDTLSIAATGALVINPNVPGSSGFDPVKELTTVAKLISIPLVVVANPKTGPKTIMEAIAQSKSAPTGISYGSTGINSSQHLSVVLLNKVTGANFIHVPYRGSGPASLAAVAGEVPMTSTDLTAAHENIKAGNLTSLGITSLKRTKLAPDLATIAEGGVSGFQGPASFIGMMAPLGTPPDKIRQISAAIAEILAKPDVQQRVTALSVEPDYEDETTFAKYLASESTRTKELIGSLTKP